MDTNIKIVCISDTHGLHDQVELPKGDILIHAGDCTNFGTTAQVSQFIHWFSEQDFKHKIFIAGNHDFFFEEQSEVLIHDLLSDYPDVIYLEDSEVTVEGLKIWGSPYTPTFFDWAFMRDRGEEIQQHWDLIPKDTDILITHGPPYRILDTAPGHKSVGCEELLIAVKKVNPMYHIFGHIHGDYGVEQQIDTTFVNASICSEQYKPINKPITIEI